MTHYTGGCQCGAVHFEVDCTLDHPIVCNCSRCQRLGSVLVFAPRAAFALTADEGALREYLFNKHRIRHVFCGTCGIQSFAYGTAPDGSEVVAVNVNCLDGVDPREIASQAQVYDGRAA